MSEHPEENSTPAEVSPKTEQSSASPSVGPPTTGDDDKPTTVRESPGLQALRLSIKGFIGAANMALEKYNEAKAENEEKDKIIHDLARELRLLETANPVFAGSVCDKAYSEITSPNSNLMKRFQDDDACEAFIMSIDIRRSTDLMLKARDAKKFAAFIIDLTDQLRLAVIERYGVFDKFTGDGILAFFPLFFAGEDAAIRVIEAADACHKIFTEHYNSSRHIFTAVVKEAGLGIGIDFGHVHLLNVAGSLTVVGNPVVYACRMGGRAGRNHVR